MARTVIRARVDAQALSDLMAKHSLSPDRLGARAGVSGALIRMLRSGKRKYTKIPTAQAIAKGLNEPMTSFARAEEL